MTTNYKATSARRAFSFSLLGLSFASFVAFTGNSSVSAQNQNYAVPGVPSTGSFGQTSPSGQDGQVLSGRVKHDILPAEKLLSQGKYADAEGMFREALVANPADAQATIGLGIALAKQFKLDGADELFDRSLAQDPNNALAYSGKATVVLNRLQSSSGSIRANRESYLQQAEEFARRAVSLAPASGESHYTLGQVYKEQGRMQEAGSEFRTAVSLDPQHSSALAALGQIKLDQNSLAEAQDNFRQAIALNSSNNSAHFGLGATLLQLGQTDEAVKELNTALYLFPNSWPTRMMLGKAYAAQGNTAGALKEFQLSTLIKPENAEPYLRMADIREERGDLELGLADLRSGLTQAPYNLDLRQRIADLTLRLEKADDAIKAYRTILQMSPNNAQAIKGLSQALYQKAQKAAVGAMLASNDYDTALKTLDEAIKLSPNDMELYLAKAKLMSLSGAKLDLATMGEPKNDGERIAYAEAAMASGDFQKASEQIKTVVSDLQDAKQTFAVADIALMIKDLDNAEAAYKKGLSLSGTPERGNRGIDLVNKAREQALADTKVANELSNKKQFDGAVNKYRTAIASNPRLADSRLGLSRALEKSKNPNSGVLYEAAQQLDYYLALRTDMPSKEREKMVKDVAKLKDKAAKQKEKENKRR
jgi:tetratricopeptide (TPR) repeat protein